MHKSCIASVSKIDGIEGNEIFIQKSRIPISRNYRKQVIYKVEAKRLWDKKHSESLIPKAFGIVKSERSFTGARVIS